MENSAFTEKRNNKGVVIAGIIAILVGLAIGAYFLFFRENTKLTPPEEQPPTEGKEKVTPLMYEITKEGSDNKIYLIGSIHYADIPNIEFPKYVTDAYNNSKYLAFEFDILKAMEKIDPEAQKASLFYTAPDSLDKHVSKESYDKIVKFMNENLKYDEERVKTMSLSYIDTLLTQLVLAESKLGNQDGVDTYFLRKGHDDNKNILEVESYEFQESLTNSFPEHIKELSIIDAIDNFDEGVKEIDDLYEAWKKGDIDALTKLLIEDDMDEYSAEDKALMLDYHKKMLDDRNIGMKNKLEEYFNNGYTVFYMVGTAHLIGDQGIAKLVELDGYTVTRVK